MAQAVDIKQSLPSLPAIPTTAAGYPYPPQIQPQQVGSFPGLTPKLETPVEINRNAFRTRVVPKIEKSQSGDKELFKNSGGPGNEESDSDEDDEAAFNEIKEHNIDMYRAGSVDPAHEGQEPSALGKREREDDIDAAPEASRVKVEEGAVVARSANPETNLITQDDLAKMNQEDEDREEEKLDGEESLDSVEVSVEDLRTDDQIYG